MTQSVIDIDPEIMGGTPVFRGTRVPVQNFFNYVMGDGAISDDGINDFFDGFPGVSREQIIRLIEDLEEVKERILVTA
uniref:Uncharacterized conserved protein, DUF433 family n=1 Tax=Candidatus Kentrum sp. DK TaxID=2126562 RepID=A0A450SWV0_9GAMM|nr:MAG: Uncharacterized conserved protein, DUF433 family [Candidatus Kentron sp. DK]